MASNSQIKDFLYKIVWSNKIPYIKPSSRINAILKGHLQMGYGAVKNT